MVGISHTAISQQEHGKLALPMFRVQQIVEACGFTMDEFYNLLGGEIKPDYRGECIRLIQKFDEETLMALHCVISQMKANQSIISKAVNN